MSSIYEEHYEQVIDDAPSLGGSDYKRLQQIKSLIPSGVKTILDCGCGGGNLGNLLKDDYDVHGCDIAETPLKRCKFPTARCPITKLPFDNHSFDLVISSEVLEHILPGEYEQACGEIERVARKWIIVTVPNREDLDSVRQQCPHCGTIFHDAWHVRSMDEKTLANSFPSFLAKQWFYVGHKKRLDYILRARVRNWLMGYPRLWPNRQCPLCHCFGTDSGQQDSGSFSKEVLCSVDNRPEWYRKLRCWALRIVPGRSCWLGVLLERQTKD